MEVRVDVRLNGIEEKLQQIGPKLARSTLRKALKAAGQVWVDEAKANVPVDTGALRESIKAVIKMSAKSEKGSVTVSPTYDPSLSKNGGDTSQDPGVYGRFVEFGLTNRKMSAAPFLRPAFDNKSEQVIAKFAEVMKEGLEEINI